MATVSIQMDTPFVLFVTPGKAETANVTITKTTMYNEWSHEDSLEDFLNETFPRKSVKNMESTKMETFYVSIIETALGELLE